MLMPASPIIISQLRSSLVYVGFCDSIYPNSITLLLLADARSSRYPCKHVFFLDTASRTYRFIRHGPFDILGGGGLGLFSKKISLLQFWLKKIILLNGTVKKNYLSPIHVVTQNSLIRMFEMSKSKNFSGSLRSARIISNLNCI